MEDSELASLVYRHMGRLDEPTRTKVFELVKAVQKAERGGCAALTEQERRTLDASASVWNLWCSLPDRCKDDNEEFAKAIHAAQYLIALRVARRADPDVWRQPNDSRKLSPA